MSPSSDAILARLAGLGIQLDLEKPRQLLAALRDPQQHYPVVLVAGTNGKGSTSTFLAAMAHAAGYKVGLYTSPHLEAVEERLRIDGASISSERLGELLDEVVETAEGNHLDLPTYFEALTHAAFLWFAAERVDLAVVEVGLGGRLDATNLSEPLLSLITSIDLDHRDFLGDTLAAIAREKAGILRAGRRALVWIEQEEPAEAVHAIADDIGAELSFVKREVEVWPTGPSPTADRRFALRTPRRSYELTTALAGGHQAQNLGLAVRAAEELEKLGFSRLGREAIENGAAKARWPGRLESVALPDGRTVLLDAAHNGAGAQVLGAHLERLARGFTLLFGVLADKDPAEMLSHLAPRARRFILTRPASERALDPQALLPLLPPGADVTIEPDPGRALNLALEGDDELIVACGSLYLLGIVRPALRRRFAVPEPAIEMLLY